MLPNRFRRYRAVLLAAALALSAGAPLSAKPGDTKSFVILHTNDQHGHLLPFSYPDRVSTIDDVAQMPVRKNIGGIARRATLVKQIRAREKHVFLFDAGDCMDGTPFSTEFKGVADYDAMNGTGYDYAVPGNHDFNMTPDEFRQIVKLVKFPFLAANLYDKDGAANPLPPYRIADWNGLKVAVLGLVTYDARTYKAAAEAYRMRDPVVVARALVPELRRQADLVVIVGHLGLNVDRRIAREVPGVDIIVGGHSHTRVPRGVYVLADNPGPSDPKGTVIVQAHQWVGELGRLDVAVTEGPDNRWNVSTYGAALLPVTDRYAEDAGVARTVASYWDRIKSKYAPVVGQATDDFSEVDGLDPTNYYLVSDAIRETLGTEIELENFGGVRAPLAKGPITAGDLVTMLPFGNTVVTFKIKGSDLKRVLAFARPAPSSTLRYVLRREEQNAPEPTADGAPRRARWRLESATVAGKPIEDDRLYTAAANSYLFDRSLKTYAVDAVDTKRTSLDILSEYVKKNTPISPKNDGRVKLLGGDAYD